MDLSKIVISLQSLTCDCTIMQVNKVPHIKAKFLDQSSFIIYLLSICCGSNAGRPTRKKRSIRKNRIATALAILTERHRIPSLRPVDDVVLHPAKQLDLAALGKRRDIERAYPKRYHEYSKLHNVFVGFPCR